MEWFIEIITPYLGTLVYKILIPIAVAVIIYYLTMLARYIAKKTGFDLSKYIKEKQILDAVKWVVATIFKLELEEESGTVRMEKLLSYLDQKAPKNLKALISEEYGSMDNFAEYVYKSYAEPQIMSAKISKQSQLKLQ